MKTPQQVQNLRLWADVLWPSVPKENVSPNLSKFTMLRGEYCDPAASRTHTDCKTVACFGGWVARHPDMQAQGVYLDFAGIPQLVYERFQLEYSGPAAVAAHLFGDGNIFYVRNNHSADRRLAPGASDHDVVTNRLHYALEQA